MKYIIVIFIGCFTMIACRKSSILSSSFVGDKSKLIGLSNDSMGKRDLIYTGNSVTGIKNYYSNSNSIYPIQYVNTDSFQYVKVIMSSDTFHSVMTYTLTPSKLPLSIDHSYIVDGIEKKSNYARFFYHLKSDILDSVLIPANNGIIIFTFTYNNQNITKIKESQVNNNQKMEVETYNFTYGITSNIFRQTDSLLYIYTYPESVFFAQPMVIAAFFAEAFSAATFNSVTTTGILCLGWNSLIISSNMNYSLNGDGKIAQESFNNNIFEGLAGKKYYYQ